VGRGPRLDDQGVAEESGFGLEDGKELDKQYMPGQVKRMGRPALWSLVSTEVSIRKGHTYRILVSDLLRAGPLVRGQDRSEASMGEFYRWLGPKKCGRIRLA